MSANTLIKTKLNDMKTKYFTAYRFLADKHLFNTHHLSYVIFSGLKF